MTLNRPMQRNKAQISTATYFAGTCKSDPKGSQNFKYTWSRIASYRVKWFDWCHHILPLYVLLHQLPKITNIKRSFFSLKDGKGRRMKRLEVTANPQIANNPWNKGTLALGFFHSSYFWPGLMLLLFISPSNLMVWKYLAKGIPTTSETLGMLFRQYSETPEAKGITWMPNGGSILNTG